VRSSHVQAENPAINQKQTTAGRTVKYIWTNPAPVKYGFGRAHSSVLFHTAHTTMGLAMIDQTAWSLIAGLAVAYTFLRLLLRLTQDEKEPKALATSIPFIGPLFGLGIGKTKFFLKLRLGIHDIFCSLN
jgi:hypothetical protein